MRVAAPAGGCSRPRRCAAAIAVAVARATPMHGGNTSRYSGPDSLLVKTATEEASMLLKMVLRGWVRGELGAPNSYVTSAPKEPSIAPNLPSEADLMPSLMPDSARRVRNTPHHVAPTFCQSRRSFRVPESGTRWGHWHPWRQATCGHTTAGWNVACPSCSHTGAWVITIAVVIPVAAW